MAMAHHDVHWSEGMLLLPQHLQVFRDFLVGRAETAPLRVGVGPYGVRAFEWRVSAETVEVVAADVTLPSGTIVKAPLECSVPAKPIGDALVDARGDVDVYIGVPFAREGVSVVATGENAMGRFLVQGVELFDEVEATERSKREVMVRRLNVRIFLGDEDRSGYDCLRVAQLTRTANLEPEPSTAFVPPLLDVTASAPLQQRLTAICDSLRKKADVMGEDVASRPFTLALQTGSDPSSIFKLHALNTELGALEQLCLTRGVHPFDTYLALCRLGGALALFSDTRRASRFPAYDHDRLSECFGAAIRQVEELVGGRIIEFFEEVGFDSASGVPVCHMQTSWFEHGTELYLGVIAPDHAPEQLDAIFGSTIKLFGRGHSRVNLQGIRLARAMARPAALPNREGCHYFRLDRETTDSRYWAHMQEALACELALQDQDLSSIDIRMFVVPTNRP